MKLGHLFLAAVVVLVACSGDEQNEQVGDVATVSSALSQSNKIDFARARLGASGKSQGPGAVLEQLKHGNLRLDPPALKRRVISLPPDPGLTLPHWTDTFVSQGKKFQLTTVGSDPALGQTTTIPVVITPYRLVFADGTVLDASSDLIDGVTPVDGLLNSPIFHAAPFTAGATPLGPTQWGDAILRANYWERLPKNDDRYHVLLEPTLAPTVTVNVPANQGAVTQDPLSGRMAGAVYFQWMEDLLASQIIASGITPNQLSVNVFSEVVLATYSGGRAYGYHWASDFSAATGIQGTQTFVETGYFGKGLFFPESLSGSMVLAHETAEWIADPTVSNNVPSWQIPTRPGLCFSPIREIADPLEDTSFTLKMPLNGRVYSFPDVVFDSYFTRSPRSRSVNQWLTLLNSFDKPSIPCSYDWVGTDSFWFTDPATNAPLETLITGINNEQGNVGYFALDGLVIGFTTAGYDPVAGNLGTASFIAMPVPDQPGLIYGVTVPTGISDTGTIVGLYNDGEHTHGFMLLNGQYTTIDVPGSLATAIYGLNNRPIPDIVGEYIDTHQVKHGFVLRNGKFTTIDSPFGVNTVVNAINDHREIVGSFDSGGHQGGFIATLPENGNDDRASGFVKVMYPGSNPDTDDLLLYGVNNAGEIVGAANVYGGTLPIELVNGVFQNIYFGFGSNGGYGALAIGVNDAGFIVGAVGLPTLGLVTETWIPYRFYPQFGGGASFNHAPLTAWRPTNVLR